MHQRSGASTLGRRNVPTVINATTNETETRAVGIGVTKKLLLWLLLILQICFIGGFWLMQTGFNANGERRLLGTAENDADGRVNFIKAAAISVRRSSNVTKRPANAALRWNGAPSFTKDFFHKKIKTINRTDFEMEAADFKAATKIWCFREGTLNETGVHAKTEEEEAELLLWQDDFVVTACKCRADWHGSDCGQPEVIWRALMTARHRLPLRGQPTAYNAHRLVWLLEGNFLNLDLLELQIRTISEVVDFFIIFFRNSHATRSEYKAFVRKLEELITKHSYIIFHCIGHLKPSSSSMMTNCSAAQAYKQFKAKRWQALRLEQSDLLLYTDERTLLSQHALNFFKYYAADVRLLRFRLKFNVYGFYWQHPQRTCLAGLISSFIHVESSHFGNGDPTQLRRHAEDDATENGGAFIVGDLNHYGGWYCHYCLQPVDIIAELQANLSSLQSVQFPNTTRNRHIDAVHIQRLIANGLFVDGKTHLLKLRPYADEGKYFAPPYAVGNSWKFGTLMSNLYENNEEEDEEDENGW